MKTQLRLGYLALTIVVTTTAWQFSQGNVVYAQAWLAQGLLHTAWVRTQASGRQVKPWPWAKTWPLALLSVPRINMEQIILSHASEGISPFALRHAENSVLPGEIGNSVLNVHHDNYFNFLRMLKPGDMIILESLRNGRWYYQISAIYIVYKTDTSLIEPSLNRRLTLVSCYPCTIEDDRRYVVVAEEVKRITS
jgi:sortase A